MLDLLHILHYRWPEHAAMILRARAAARSPASSPRRALPRTWTSFVGRAGDLAAIRRRVEEGAQLVTLLGPPGIGKTRLALRAAEEAAGDATFCDLCDARDGAAMLTRVALALGVPVEAPGSDEALTALVGRALDQRGETLLVLDNAEQIAGAAAAAVARWMDAAPGALFLVTSRERLRVAGEHVLVLGPLGVPAREETSPERILASEAVTLIVDRARAAHVGFARARADAAALAEIARRVEGVPLALELCAGRLGMLEPAQLLARLERRLDVLTGRLRAAPRRQATLRGAIDGSWDLLDAAERRVLAQCSVFRGGFDLEAAEAVLSPAPAQGSPDSPAVLDVLTALHDKSLLAVVDADPERPVVADSLGARAALGRRYRLYESVRAYAAEKLSAMEDRSGTTDRHVRYFARFGERWAAAARGPAFKEGLAALGCESDNLLAARASAAGAGDLATALEVTLCLEPLAIVRGPVPPYLALLQETLDAAGGRVPPRLLARALGSRGVAESRLGLPREAVASFRQAVSMAELEGEGAPFLLAKLGNQLCVLGDTSAAADAFGRALALLDRRDDPAVRGVFCRHHAFFLWRAGRVAEARREGEQARALLSASGDRRELAYVLCDVAASDLDAGDVDQATACLGQGLDLLRELGYRRVEGRCLLLLALARREQGRFDDAATYLERALALHVEDGDRAAEGFALWHLGCLSLERDDAEGARRSLAQALARYVELGDAHLVAHARMVLGAALARAGAIDAAEAELALADALLAGGPAAVLDALALFRAQVPLARAVAASECGDHPGAAAARATAESALAALEAHSGIPVAHVRFARRVLVRALGASLPARGPTAPATAPDAELLMSADGRWFRLASGREVSLERRAALRRILAALASLRVEAPDTALPLDGVLEAGWPGERVSAASGAARVYNAVQRLRRLGLDGALRTRDDGYLLDPGLSIRIAARA